MKKLTLVLFVLMLALLILPSCTKKDGVESNKAPMTCKLDGKNWEAVDSLSFAQKMRYSDGAEGISLRFARRSYEGKYGEFTINHKPPKIGDFDMDVNSVFKTNDPLEQTYFVKSGKISITKIDDLHVEGTFSLKAANFDDSKSINVTDGKFNVKYK